MDAQRLLIAENNEDIRTALSRALQSFHYVRCCSSGKEALDILRREKPELLVLDMSLPEIDSLTLLETIAAENIRPMVLALTAYRSDYLEASAHRLGIAYILMKPFSLDAIVRRVLDMKDYLKALPAKPTAQQLLENRLAGLKILPRHSGYPVMSYVTIHLSADPDNLLCKEAYLDAARHFGLSYYAVETRIRRLIASHCDPDAWQELFPDSTGLPSAREFLQRMARLLRADLE